VLALAAGVVATAPVPVTGGGAAPTVPIHRRGVGRNGRRRPRLMV
jgi:hypothetical protein